MPSHFKLDYQNTKRPRLKFSRFPFPAPLSSPAASSATPSSMILPTGRMWPSLDMIWYIISRNCIFYRFEGFTNGDVSASTPFPLPFGSGHIISSSVHPETTIYFLYFLSPTFQLVNITTFLTPINQIMFRVLVLLLALISIVLGQDSLNGELPPLPAPIGCKSVE